MCIHAVNFSIWIFINDLGIEHFYYNFCFSHSIKKKMKREKKIFSLPEVPKEEVQEYIPI